MRQDEKSVDNLLSLYPLSSAFSNSIFEIIRMSASHRLIHTVILELVQVQKHHVAELVEKISMSPHSSDQCFVP